MKIESNTSLKQYIKTDELAKLFYAEKEHYTLLTSVSTQYNNTTLYDIGTYRGLSALALSSNPTNKVISYDIGYYVEIDRPSNVEFRIGDCYNDANLLQAPLIVVDVDPHDGIFETQFVKYLTDKGYVGTVIFDDIHLNKGMSDFWNSITQEKNDFTSVGHWSGTGVVNFKR